MIASNINLIQDSARKAIVRLHADEKGQGMTEYVIVLVAIAVVCIAITVEFGGKIKSYFESASLGLDGVDQNY